MVSTLYSMGISGVEAFLVKIESDISKGMPTCDIVGLPDNAVKESKNRVRAAIKNCGFQFPVARITINLAPADVKKSGSLYDLPIFMSILYASNQICKELNSSIFIGELSLNGDVCAVNGVLPMTLKAKKLGFKNIFVPLKNAEEASIIKGINVYAIKNISELTNHLLNDSEIKVYSPTIITKKFKNELLDFSQVKGQIEVKRALEIAAAGGHNVLMIGSPGSGKSMLAKRMLSILPEMTFEETLETTAIYSASGMLKNGTSLVTQRPFRAPHYTISTAGLCGGGSIIHPGEITFAHNGILFLDELSEFSRNTLETLRQPLEDGYITISRSQNSIIFPSSIMLIAAMNPCPCGYYGHHSIPCTCSALQIEKYMSKISGPILDRIDIHIEVPSVKFEDLNSNVINETSEKIIERVTQARNIQIERYKKYNILSNVKLPSHLIAESCPLTPSAEKIFKNAFNSLSLSARAYNKVLKLARTIADLEGNEIINTNHISEAIQYRNLDRKFLFHLKQ